ncbi:MAG TPA: hypothetical protein VF220_06225 [Nitrososphaeraceae archaeon]
MAAKYGARYGGLPPRVLLLETQTIFCELSEIPPPWKKITRGFPRARQAANDRAPTLEEIRKLSEYPDRRIKPILYTMCSSVF